MASTSPAPSPSPSPAPADAQGSGRRQRAQLSGLAALRVAFAFAFTLAPGGLGRGEKRDRSVTQHPLWKKPRQPQGVLVRPGSPWSTANRAEAESQYSPLRRTGSLPPLLSSPLVQKPSGSRVPTQREWAKPLGSKVFQVNPAGVRSHLTSAPVAAPTSPSEFPFIPRPWLVALRSLHQSDPIMVGEPTSLVGDPRGVAPVRLAGHVQEIAAQATCSRLLEPCLLETSTVSQ